MSSGSRPDCKRSGRLARKCPARARPGWHARLPGVASDRRVQAPSRKRLRPRLPGAGRSAVRSGPGRGASARAPDRHPEERGRPKSRETGQQHPAEMAPLPPAVTAHPPLAGTARGEQRWARLPAGPASRLVARGDPNPDRRPPVRIRKSPFTETKGIARAQPECQVWPLLLQTGTLAGGLCVCPG